MSMPVQSQVAIRCRSYGGSTAFSRSRVIVAGEIIFDQTLRAHAGHQQIAFAILPGFHPHQLVTREHPGAVLERHLAAGLEQIRSRQVTRGSLAGSWAPWGRWSPAGGRLTSTALAALTLAAGDPQRPTSTRGRRS